jgi:transposase-like protein
VGRRGYPPEFRRKVLDLVASGRKVSEVAFDLEISEQTIYSWVKPAAPPEPRRIGPARFEQVLVQVHAEHESLQGGCRRRRHKMREG